TADAAVRSSRRHCVEWLRRAQGFRPNRKERGQKTMNVRPSRRESSGFTLIELVISAALMALILVSAYLCMSACVSSQKLIEPRIEAFQSARVALAIMTADLRSACPLSKESEFVGMHRTLKDAEAGKDVEADNLDFATHNY